METEYREPGRRHPASGVFISLEHPTIVFLTVCTKDRRPWLAQSVVHETLVQVWNEANAWLVGEYVLMPDHLHLFCSPQALSFTLDQWVRYWKSLFSKRIQQPEYRWQTGHWDTRLRRSENYREKWAYVRMNPVRKGLVAASEFWPFQGPINALRW
jgi:putative transposase